MSRRIVLCLLPLALIGCTDHDRDAAVSQGADLGRQAAKRVASVAGDAWKAASEQASKLSPDSAQSALESAKSSLEKAKDSLKPGERLAAAEAEINRLRAALDLQKLHRELDDKVAEAQRLKENAGQTVDDVKAKLAAADQTYKDLNSKLSSAEKSYEEAATAAQNAAKAVRERLGG